MNTVTHSTIVPSHMPDFSNPLALLVHCHEKIDYHLCSLEQAVESLRSGQREKLKYAFADVSMASAHFAVPGVKHTEDEEISLFPRLREHGGEAGQEALAAMEELESQHGEAERIHAEFDALVASMPRDGSADARDVDRFGELIAMLCALYRPHIRVENELVFPVAARVLSAQDIQQLGAEMRARRQVLLQRFQAR